MNMMRKLTVIMLISLMVIPPGNINFVYAVSEMESNNEGPTLEVYQSGNSVKTEWAVEMLDEDIIFQTGFEEGDTLMDLDYGKTPRGHGGQSYSTEEAYSGSRSLKVENTIENGNQYTGRDLDGNFTGYTNNSYSSFVERAYMDSGTDLSVSFRVKSKGKANIRVIGSGGTSSYGRPTGVLFTQDVKPGDTTFHVSSISYFRNQRSISLNKTTNAAARIASIDEQAKTVTLQKPFLEGFKSGEPVLALSSIAPVAFQARDVSNRDDWELFNVNTKVSEYPYYDVATRGFRYFMQTHAAEEVYIDEIKMGYATETELYRGNTLLYKGKLSDYEDKAAIDKSSPDAVNDFTYKVNGESRVLNLIEPKDNGSTYNYHVKAITKDGLDEYSSGIEPVTVTSGIAGYSYVINNSNSGVPSGIINSTGSISIPESTKQTDYIHIQAIDNQGNKSDVTSYSISELERSLPRITLTVEGGDYEQRHSTVARSVPADSEIKSFEYAWTTDERFPTSGFNAIPLVGAPIRTPENTGDYYLHLRVEDAKGNIQSITSNVFKVDNTLPTLNLSRDTDSWTNDSVKLTALGIDEHSGIEAVALLEGGGIRGINLLSMNDIKTWHGDSYRVEGNKYIFSSNSNFHGGIYYDGTHVERGKNYVFSFDIEKLSGSIPYLGGHLNISDDVEILIDGETPVPLEEDRNSIPATNNWHKGLYYPNDNNKHHVEIRFKVNNELTTLDQRIFIQINRLMYDTGNEYTVEISNIQLEEGNYETDYEPNIRDATKEGNPLEYTAYANGEYSFIAFDKAGNFIEESISVDNIDNDSPYMTITTERNEVSHEDVILSIEAGDDLSGVRRIKTPDDQWITGDNLKYTATGNGVYRFTVEDNAGNTHTSEYTVDNIERTLSFEGPTVKSNLSIPIQAEMIVDTEIKDLIITDWRDDANNWRLLLKASPLNSINHSLPSGIISVKGVEDIIKLDGDEGGKLTWQSDEILIDEGQVEILLAESERGVHDVKFKHNALKFNLPVGLVKKGVYNTRLTWTLESTPTIQ